MIGTWALGFATALALDATLFDGYPIWLGAPMLAALAAMTAITKQRDRARRNHKATPTPAPAATEPPAWTPPPPGDTREQLPTHLLALIRDRLPDYLSTACQTADLLACFPGSGVPRPQYDELREHAERLHQRCRLNHKFTGQLCACGCHPEPERPT